MHSLVAFGVASFERHSVSAWTWFGEWNNKIHIIAYKYISLLSVDQCTWLMSHARMDTNIVDQRPLKLKETAGTTHPFFFRGVLLDRRSDTMMIAKGFLMDQLWFLLTLTIRPLKESKVQLLRYCLISWSLSLCVRTLAHMGGGGGGKESSELQTGLRYRILVFLDFPTFDQSREREISELIFRDPGKSREMNLGLKATLIGH